MTYKAHFQKIAGWPLAAFGGVTGAAMGIPTGALLLGTAGALNTAIKNKKRDPKDKKSVLKAALVNGGLGAGVGGLVGGLVGINEGYNHKLKDYK